MRITFILIALSNQLCFAQGEKYGALAVDRNNGFFYGYAYDHSSLSAAKSRALKECSDKGGNCQIVKTWRGGYCMVYRTVAGNVGTAYGWGVAKSKGEADMIASKECLERSNGNPCSNHVWGCNSKDDDDDDPKTNNDDDFWNGKKDKTKNDTHNDFWNGSGTQKEELKLEENTKAEESDKFIGNVRSRTKRIRIFCVDTGKEDGDKVKISNNGKVLKTNIYLTNQGKSYWFDLEFGQNKIEIYALNQGSLGANTAAFKIFDENGLEIAQKDWHLKTGYKGTLLILKI